MDRRIGVRVRPFLVAGVLGLVALATACGGPLLAPSSSSVTISATSRSIPVGGSTEVNAFVAEQSGTPVQNGTLVRFNTSLGRVEPVEAETRNGIAVTTFYGDASGVADVRATSGSIGGASGASAATNVVQITVGEAVEVVTLSANPASVPSTGGTVNLLAVVVAASGRGIPNIPVTFTSSEGQLSSARVTTDAAGEARVTLNTDRNATVTAAAGTKTSNQVTVTRRDPAPAPNVTISAGTPDTATAQGQRWPFTATVTGDDATSRPTTYEWTFGDGTTATTNGNTTAHVYTTTTVRVARTVSVRVTLANGQTITASTDILVASFP
jgi:hypothetical protein